MSVEVAIRDAIDEHADEGDGCGSPVGAVLETVLDETSSDLGRVTMVLRRLLVTGEIYQPNPTSIKQVRETNGGVRV